MRGCVAFSIVPSIAVIIGLFSLALCWARPGPGSACPSWALQYELMAADLAATGAGYESLSAFAAADDPSALGTIMFVMSISIMAGMVCNIFLTKRICMTANSLTAKGRLGRAGYLLLHHGHDVYLQFRTADLRADPCPGLCCGAQSSPLACPSWPRRRRSAG